MLAALDISGITCEDPMDRAVCVPCNRRCVMGKCGDCSGGRCVVDFIPIIGSDADDDMDAAEVRYRQWVITDLCKYFHVS